jgi:hypothetical protein
LECGELGCGCGSLCRLNFSRNKKPQRFTALWLSYARVFRLELRRRGESASKWKKRGV